MPEQNDFRTAIKGKKMPLLVQDEKWQQLFALGGKTDAVISSEAELKVLLKKQTELEEEQRELKKQKKQLMENVVRDMEGAQLEKANTKVAKRLDEDKRQLDKTNDRLEAIKDRLLELPKDIDRANGELMVHTMDFCYEKLRVNHLETTEINKWIEQVRIDLKRNLIKKQNRELNSRQIYSYMHDIFGPQILNLFDLRYEDFSENKKKADTEKPAGENEPKEDKVTAKTDAVEEEKEIENFETE